MYMASLDVKTASDVAKPSVVSHIPSLIGTHGHVVAALLAEMQGVKVLACVENCQTEFCFLTAYGMEEWSHQCCESVLVSTYCGKLKKDGKPEEGVCHSEGNLTTSTYCGV